MAAVLPTSDSQTAEAIVRAASQADATNSLESRVVLYNVSWNTYERLTEEIRNPGTRLLYEEGTLEIMSPSERHDRFKELIGRLVEVVIEELDMPCRSTGSTTWKQRTIGKGLEADKSYYLTSAPQVRGKLEVDQGRDPPPDLAIEIENTSSAVNQLGIYSALGVPEVWRFDGKTLTILALRSGRYKEQTRSQFLPLAATIKIVEWMAKCDELDETVWIKQFRGWVRENLVKST